MAAVNTSDSQLTPVSTRKENPVLRMDIKSPHYSKIFDAIQGGNLVDTDESSGVEDQMEEPISPDQPENELLQSTVTLASYMCRLPFNNGLVDQVTVGHQVIGDSLALILPLSDFPMQTKKLSDLSQKMKTKISPWIYTGTNREIQIFSIPGNSKESIFTVAGIGIINEEAQSVWDVVRNPACRGMYDRSMKGYKLIQKVNEYTQVVKTKFSVKNCIDIHQREALVVVSERKLTDQKFICSSRSTHHQLCPKDKNIRRVDIQTCTFMVEQFVDSNLKKVSKVTYVVKVDLPGLPKTIVDYVIKRQPLSIAYIRDSYDWN